MAAAEPPSRARYTTTPARHRRDGGTLAVPHRGGLGARELIAPGSATPSEASDRDRHRSATGPHLGHPGQTVGEWTVAALSEIFSGDIARAQQAASQAFAHRLVVTSADSPVPPEDLRAHYGRLFIHREVPDEPTRPITLPVIERTEHWLAIAKPAGIATIPRGSYVARSVTVAARRQWHNDDIVPIHRLDRLTSGVLLLSSDKTSRGAYQQLFAQRKVGKSYLAASVPPVRRDTPLPKNPGEGQLITLRMERAENALGTAVVPGPPNTQTAVHLAGISRGIWYWRLTPHTGRMHQLRATMAHFGAPLLGDPLYPRALPAQHPQWESGLRLHSYRLSFIDPLTVVSHDVRCPVAWWPEHFEY